MYRSPHSTRVFAFQQVRVQTTGTETTKRGPIYRYRYRCIDISYK